VNYDVTRGIKGKTKVLGEGALQDVTSIFVEKALRVTTIHRYDALTASVNDFGSVLDMEASRGVMIEIGVGPLGLGTDHPRRILKKAPRIVGDTLAVLARRQGIHLNQH